MLDLRIRLATGEQVDIEMQSRPHPALSERILYYWARLYADQLARGDDYTELRRTACVLFADFAVPESSCFHSIFRVHEEQTHARFTDHLELHVIELPRLRVATAENDGPLLVLWCKFLSATSDAELEALAQEHAIMTQAKAALEELSTDPAARRRAEYRRMSEMAYWTGINAARREGKAEGREEGKAEGREEGKADSLHALLTLKFGQLSADTTDRLHAANEAQLDNWLKRILTAASLDEVLTEREHR